MQEKSLTYPAQVSFASKFQDYVQLTKFRLSSLVVFSAGMGYVIAAGNEFSWAKLLVLMLGGFLVTGGANGINQVLERDLDKLMVRTANRPLPTGRMSVSEAVFSSSIMGISGVAILWLGLNPLCGMLSMASLLLYALIYTPSKKITPFSVLIGAFPGAFPPLLGWVAFRNEIGMEALVLYAIQFVWQFPHFWAIAWVLNDDYKRAGFRMLPSDGGRTKNSAFQALVYTMCLIPMALVPQIFGFTGTFSTTLMILTGVFFSIPAFRLYKSCETKDAQKLSV